MVRLNKTDKNVMAALKESGESTLQEISEKTGEPSKKVFKSLRKLFENEFIQTNARKYKLSTINTPPKPIKTKQNCLNDKNRRASSGP